LIADAVALLAFKAHAAEEEKEGEAAEAIFSRLSSSRSLRSAGLPSGKSDKSFRLMISFSSVSRY
jgi:hypothetical protein